MRRRDTGFTLLELLIYTGILGTVSLLGVSILSQVSRTYLQTQARTEVTANLRTASQIIQQAIQSATAINTAASSSLILETQTGTTTFSLSSGVVYKQDDIGPQYAVTSNRVDVTTLSFSIVSAPQAVIDPINHYAWNGNATGTGWGWIDFAPAAGNVRAPVGEGDFYGYARIVNLTPEGSGWIALNCATPDACTYPYKVSSDANGDLSGWAWSDYAGWISFASTTPIAYKVTISTTTGDFSGWAWSSNIGWISFNCDNSGIGNTCGTSNYKVALQKKVGRPINAVQVTISLQYKPGISNPLAAYNETYTFAVALSQAASLGVTSINPAAAPSGTATTTTIVGANFKSGATARLSRSGFFDINASGCNFFDSTTLNSCSFNLTSAATGVWDVWVINPDGQIGVLPQGFTVN